jgi:hypothetical protein
LGLTGQGGGSAVWALAALFGPTIVNAATADKIISLAKRAFMDPSFGVFVGLMSPDWVLTVCWTIVCWAYAHSSILKSMPSADSRLQHYMSATWFLQAVWGNLWSGAEPLPLQHMSAEKMAQEGSI